MRAVLSLLLVAACGARTGLDEAAPGDAGRLDAPTDAPRSDARDAGPARCPEPPAFGYAIAPLGTFPLEREVVAASLGGDGTELYLAVSSAEPASELLLAPDPLSVHVEPGADLAAVRVSAGLATATFSRSATGEITLLRAGFGRPVDLQRTSVARGPLRALDRPIEAATATLLVGETSFEVVVAAFDDTPRPWLGFGPAHDVHAARSSDDRVHVLVQGGDERYVVDVLRSGGVEGRVRLADLGFTPPTSIGFLEDGIGQPYLIAGFVDAPEPRLVVRRFREDGTAGAGFSAPMARSGRSTSTRALRPATRRATASWRSASTATRSSTAPARASSATAARSGRAAPTSRSPPAPAAT